MNSTIPFMSEATAEKRVKTKARISLFARRLLAEWQRLKLPLAQSRTLVAVSGGADSMAQLLAFDELVRAGRLSLELVVAHLDHGLRGECGRTDAKWVELQVASLGYAAVIGAADVKARAANSRDNLEQAARRARFEFLTQAARERCADTVVLAHTLDDQAETVLLRLLRGSGAEGLGGMRAVRPLAEESAAHLSGSAPPAVVARPLLGWARREDTEGYCHSRGQEFLCDPMNEDMRFARVRVRKELLPLLRSFNPRIEETLARTAALLRDDVATLDIAASVLLQEATTSAHMTPPCGLETGTDGLDAEANFECLDVGVLASASVALQRRALRRWLRSVRGHLRRVDRVHISALQSLLAGERGGRVVEIPGGGRVERRGGRLRFTE